MRRSSLFALFVLLLGAVPVPAAVGRAEEAGTSISYGSANVGSQVGAASTEPSYFDVLEQWKKEGASTSHGETVTIAADRLVGRSENAHVSIGAYGGKNGVLVWGAEGNEWIEYEVDIARGGLYVMELSYHPFVDAKHRKPVALQIAVDGASPYAEAKSILLYRRWKDQLPPRKDARGDEIRPQAEDISGWMTAELRDSAGAYEDPLLWRLTPGKHRIRLSGSDPIALESIVLRPPRPTADYASVLSGWPSGTPAVDAEPIEIQAEQVTWKNDPAIALMYDNDIANEPYVRGKITFNTIGGERWATGNQEIAWSFEVPETGYYQIALRVRQSFVTNRSSFRTIMINGEVPFAELKAYRFPYATGWRGVVLTAPDGEPYRFYLQKGTNTLSMRATQAPFYRISLDLQGVIDGLKKLHNDLLTLTGGVVDPNRTWDIERDLPGFVEQLSALKDRIDAARVQVEQVNGRPDAVSQALETIRRDVESLLGDPDRLPYSASRLVTLQGRIAEQIEELGSQPLQVDRIFVVPVGKPLPKMEATWWEKLIGGIINFFNSFRRSESLSATDEDVLQVWVYRGRDYVNLLQKLADEMFTPKTGIPVKVNLLKDEKLLLMMNAAGIAPDVVLGVPQGLPFDYAIRNGLYNLKQFPDFNEVFRRFAPGAWIPFYYDGGYYGVPETQTFQVMYYRKDIFQQLGLNVPNTWEELYKILPTLQQNGMNFTPVEHSVFLQMHGAQYYQQDGSKTALATEKGFDAFRQWTDLQNKYAVDERMDSFYQHFRDGSYPIGVADLNTYIQLTVAAPELNGQWGVAPLPGVRSEDGSVVRWAGGNMQASIIFRNTNKPKESWEFLKWWTSAEVQERYGNELETLYGVTFRWNTANVEAFVQLPWKKEDLAAILEQWRWFREIPNVPGGYLMEREIQNAWNRTVVDGMNFRTSLEMSMKEVDREIWRKLQEFGFVDASGAMVRTLNLPVVTEPWEGAAKYLEQ